MACPPSPTPITVPACPEHLASPPQRPQDGVHRLTRLHVGTGPAAPGLIESLYGSTMQTESLGLRLPRHHRACHTVAEPSLLRMCWPRQTPLPRAATPAPGLQPPSLGRLPRTRPSPCAGMACFLPNGAPGAPTLVLMAGFPTVSTTSLCF